MALKDRQERGGQHHRIGGQHHRNLHSGITGKVSSGIVVNFTPEYATHAADGIMDKMSASAHKIQLTGQSLRNKKIT